MKPINMFLDLAKTSLNIFGTVDTKLMSENVFSMADTIFTSKLVWVHSCCNIFIQLLVHYYLIWKFQVSLACNPHFYLFNLIISFSTSSSDCTYISTTHRIQNTSNTKKVHNEIRQKIGFPSWSQWNKDMACRHGPLIFQAPFACTWPSRTLSVQLRGIQSLVPGMHLPIRTRNFSIIPTTPFSPTQKREEKKDVY